MPPFAIGPGGDALREETGWRVREQVNRLTAGNFWLRPEAVCWRPRCRRVPMRGAR